MRRCLALACLAAACGDDASAPRDAAPRPDAFVVTDGAPGDAPPLAWVDFTASGCERIEEPPADDAGAPILRCRGPAPLSVQFASIAPGAPGSIDRWTWSFGDDANSSEPSPRHTYERPGRYDVALSAGGPGGTATAARAGFIDVVPAVLGAACSDSAQCASATCLCGGDASCPDGLRSGLCVASCGVDCDGICAIFGGSAPWGGAWCLAACTGESECPAGRTCDVVATATGWSRGCLPYGGLAPLGASCAGASGPDDSLCAGGACLAIGARGACTVACGDGAPCPDGSRCAAFNNGTRTCVAACAAPDDCGDPWLGCEPPHPSGAWGFTLDGGDGTVCAPRRCDDAAGCPGGACVDGHCGPR